jgi:hypothetical protein
MSGEPHSDQEYLLRHAASIKKDILRLDSSICGSEYELLALDIGDMGLHQVAAENLSPPSYSSTWDHTDIEIQRNGKGSDDEVE